MLARNTLDRSFGLAGYLPDNRAGTSKPVAAIPEEYDFEDDDDIEEDEKQDFDARTPQVEVPLQKCHVWGAGLPCTCRGHSEILCTP